MKHWDKPHKYEKAKPNKYTKRDFHNNCSRISKYQNLEQIA